MPSTAKHSEMTAFESVRAKTFTRVHGRPTRRDYEILKEEAYAPANEVEDITYVWSKNNTDNYGLLADIMGVEEYDNLTSIAIYRIPNEPASYDSNILDTTPTHTRRKKNGILFGPRGSSQKVSCGAWSTTSAMPLTSNFTPNSASD